MVAKTKMTGSEGYDFMMRFYPDARRPWTPAQRVWIIAAWDALPLLDRDKPAWFLLSDSGPEGINKLTLVEEGHGAFVLEEAKRGW